MGGRIVWPTRTENIREVKAFRRTQNDDNFQKANKVSNGVEDNIVILTEDGDIKDSGKSFDDVEFKEKQTRTIDADYQIIEEDVIIWIDASTGNITVTMLDPTNITGRTFQLQRIDNTANTVTISGGGYLLNGVASGELRRQWAYIKPTSDGIGYKI